MSQKPTPSTPPPAPKPTAGTSAPFRTRGPAKAVGAFVPGITQKAFQKYGFSAAQLITDWPAIVGRDLAACTAPERLKWPKGVEAYGDGDPAAKGRPGATLILRVEAARALDVQYKARQIGERINAYFGYRAIAEIRLLQAALPVAAPSRAVRPTADDAVSLPAVGDQGLRAALEKLGAGIRAKVRRGTKDAR